MNKLIKFFCEEKDNQLFLKANGVSFWCFALTIAIFLHPTAFAIVFLLGLLFLGLILFINWHNDELNKKYE